MIRAFFHCTFKILGGGILACAALGGLLGGCTTYNAAQALPDLQNMNSRTAANYEMMRPLPGMLGPSTEAEAVHNVLMHTGETMVELKQSELQMGWALLIISAVFGAVGGVFLGIAALLQGSERLLAGRRVSPR
jgi:hypothetical protein